MKRLKWGVVAFLAGEFLALWRKDKQFQQWLDQKDGREKVKHVFDGLLDFNKELVEEASAQFDKAKLEEQLQAGVSRVKEEYTMLHTELQWSLTKGKAVVEQILWNLQQRLDEWTQTAMMVKENIEDEFHLEEKLAELKKLLAELVKKASST